MTTTTTTPTAPTGDVGDLRVTERAVGHPALHPLRTSREGGHHPYASGFRNGGGLPSSTGGHCHGGFPVLPTGTASPLHRVYAHVAASDAPPWRARGGGAPPNR